MIGAEISLIEERSTFSSKNINISECTNLCDWDVLDIAVCIKTLKFANRIVFSSLDSIKLRKAYEKLYLYISIEVLSENNINDLINGAIDIFIYDENGYSDKSIKSKCISCNEFYDLLYEETIKKIMDTITLTDKWLSLNINECDIISCIKLFDRGRNSICIIDDNKKLLGLICNHHLKQIDLLRFSPQIQGITIEYSADENSLRRNLAKIYLKNTQSEIPYCLNNEVVGLAVKENPYDIVLRWNYINNDDVKSYFRNIPRILLSSKEGKLGDFYDRYNSILQLDIVSEDNLACFFTEQYDLLIYGGDIWPDAPTIKMNIDEIYLDLLTLTTTEFLKKCNVGYKFIYLPKKKQIPNWQFRIGKIEKELDYSVTNRNGEMIILDTKNNNFSSIIQNDHYYFFSDIITKDIHISSGNRKVESLKNEYSHKVFMYGYCPVFCIHSDNKHTIASHTQEIFNKDGIDYQVINSVCPPLNSTKPHVRSDINTFYRILNTEFSPNDYVIMFGIGAFKSPICDFEGVSKEYSSDAYLRFKDVRCMADNSVAHLNAAGNEMFAKWLYTILKEELKVTI